jgi:hypothetical protein
MDETQIVFTGTEIDGRPVPLQHLTVLDFSESVSLCK